MDTKATDHQPPVNCTPVNRKASEAPRTKDSGKARRKFMSAFDVRVVTAPIQPAAVIAGLLTLMTKGLIT
jgi:hypothetical protein